LAQFLDNLAQNKAAQRALYRVRIFTTLGTEELSLIAEKLRDDPSINREAKRKFTEIIQAGYPKKGSEEFAKARELARTRFKKVNGKRIQSGVELFAQVLVPNKRAKRQLEARLLAYLAAKYLRNTSRKEYMRVASHLNLAIDANNKILADFESGKRGDHEGWNPGVPKRKITPHQLENAHRKFKPEIDKAKGITRHRSK